MKQPSPVIARQRVARMRPMTGSAKQSIARAVIASEAKQSILPRQKKSVDCFGAALLAMTGRVRGGMKQTLPVIASEAKQSIAPRKERMDCFAALKRNNALRH